MDQIYQGIVYVFKGRNPSFCERYILWEHDSRVQKGIRPFRNSLMDERFEKESTLIFNFYLFLFIYFEYLSSFLEKALFFICIFLCKILGMIKTVHFSEFLCEQKLNQLLYDRKSKTTLFCKFVATSKPKAYILFMHNCFQKKKIMNVAEVESFHSNLALGLSLLEPQYCRMLKDLCIPEV